MLKEGCDNSTGECFSPNKAVPWETDFAALVPRFTGSLSAVSSALIIYVILRSKTGLSSIYHRIMFGMSLADTFGSIAMALTSLPMPSYMPKEEVFGYHWAGSRLGNTTTCNAQGFFSTFGMIGMFHYNAMLCVYYACAIAFTMREKNIQKYVEPFLHALPLIVGLAFSIPPLFYEMYNPGISTFAWCGFQPYPDECSYIHHVECIRGNSDMKHVSQTLISIIIMCDFACIVLSLMLVVFKVIQTDHVLKQISKLYRDRGNAEMENVLQKHRNTKAVIIQASCYIAAFVLGIMPPALLSVGAVQSSGKDGHDVADLFEKLTLVLLPLQGFFNFIIFVSHKVYNYRRVHPHVSTCHVLSLLFRTSTHEPFFISRISVVQRDHEERQDGDKELNVENMEQGAGVVVKEGSVVYELDVQDESNQELCYRLGLMHSTSHDDACSSDWQHKGISESRSNMVVSGGDGGDDYDSVVGDDADLSDTNYSFEDHASFSFIGTASHHVQDHANQIQ